MEKDRCLNTSYGHRYYHVTYPKQHWHLLTLSEVADQLQWSSHTKVRGCSHVRPLIWFEPMSVYLGAQCVFPEEWFISCQSRYQNYTWCLSSLSLFLFCLTACATSKKATWSFSTLADIWEKVLGNCRCTLSPQSCSLCEQYVYQDVSERMRKDRIFHASHQRKLVKKERKKVTYLISSELAHLPSQAS